MPESQKILSVEQPERPKNQSTTGKNSEKLTSEVVKASWWGIWVPISKMQKMKNIKTAKDR